uniref:protein TONSOKU n=1 Tax=Erigeron canadensis TaxID=72917 RepID=UPI001CB8DDE9|nr:protein TONSOKU [Erigeron canadensis]
MKTRKDEGELIAAKRGYKNASAEGNRQEEARWANVIGDILKKRGEYVEALKWYRIDYEVSTKYLPQKHLLPTCQSLGEVHLRLQNFQDALHFQREHLDLANDAGDLVEQQRASTQLGRTYYEMFLNSDSDQPSLRNAKKYFISAMKLAHTLKKSNKQSFLKEYIDSHNNIGMVEMDLDNLQESEKILTRGLQICDEEEVSENDDGRTRLHHNLGNVYLDLRKWDKAKKHIEKDIVICKNIGHAPGEAKGYINLGELHYRVQKYEEADLCYQKAMELAKSMDDEYALADQINQNIEVVKKATQVMEEMKKEEQKLKKLSRNVILAKGTSGERKLLLQQNASLDSLIDKSSTIFAWKKHCEFAKKKKKIAREICDKEKLGDSYLVIGESYQKLRNFNKAKKWYSRCWETYKSIGNIEGQALAKINLGGVMDSVGKWSEALDEFREGYRIACEANLPLTQLSALENMHYSQMIRFDNVGEARRLQSEIDKLKQAISDAEPLNVPKDCCSETDTEGDNISLVNSGSKYSPNPSLSKSYGNNLSEDDVPLVSLSRSDDYRSKSKRCSSTKSLEASNKSVSKSCSQTVSRKRGRLLLSDDEDEYQEVRCPNGKIHESPQEHVSICNDFNSRKDLDSHTDEYQDVSPVSFKYESRSCNPVHTEESTSSLKGRSLKLATQTAKDFRCSNPLEDDSAGVYENLCHKMGDSGSIYAACEDEYCKHIIFKVMDDFVHIEPVGCKYGGKQSIDDMKVEVACLYYLKLNKEKRIKGDLPIIHHFKCGREVIESLETLDTSNDYMCGKCWVEVSIGCWEPKSLVMRYVDCCNDLSEQPNLKLLKKLYILTESADEIDVSECGLKDAAVAPLINALQLHNNICALNLSHNLLGNATIEKLNGLFTSPYQKSGDLVLDLHCNLFGPTALLQICECNVIVSRLEVLNISGNNLNDKCSTSISTILQNCKALYSLNMERCSITSRIIKKITESLNSGSSLQELSIGYNSDISEIFLVSLLDKLATLKSFTRLSVNGIKLEDDAVDSLCELIKATTLSHLMIGDTSIGTERAIQLMDSFGSKKCDRVKLDLSSCLLTANFIMKLNMHTSLISHMLELNAYGNPLMQEGGIALASLLKNPHCKIKVLDLSKCQLSLVCVLGILQSLATNTSIMELNLSENALQGEYDTLVKVKSHEEVSLDGDHDLLELEVADSEDEANEPRRPGRNVKCKSSFENHVFKSNRTFIQELSSAISAATHLQLLDVSNNGFSEQVGETLYDAWLLKPRGGLTQRHIQGGIIHLSAEPNLCCNAKPCCKK